MLMRAAGAAMVAVAVAPWLGGGSASAAVTVYLDAKWDGTSSATSTVSQAGCDYAEVTDISHKSQGWHFVLPGGSGLTSFTANFATAGKVTVTTTDSANGVIVQGGKGAVIFTNGADTLKSTADFASHPGQGSAATAGNNDMQLSHLCNGEPTPPVDECTNLPGDQATVPAGYTQDSNRVCTPVSTPPPVDVCSNIQGNQATVPAGYTRNQDGTCTATPSTAATTPAAVVATATPQVSVLPTKAAHTPKPTTSVKGVKVPRVLPHTGAGPSALGLTAVSLGLLLLGGALLAAPNLAVQRAGKRRH